MSGDNPFITDLRFAQQASRCVKVRTYSGQTFELNGVADVDPDGEWVSLHTPQTMQDDTTRARIETSDIAGVTVTDIAWKAGGA